MVFTGILYLFFFFPAVVGMYYGAAFLAGKRQIRRILLDWILVGFSLGFYGWACFDNLYRLPCCIFLLWLCGSFLEDLHKHKKKFLVILLMAAVFVLWYFRYYHFTLSNISRVLPISFTDKTILEPLGISFLVFSAISYIVDVYRGTKAGSLMDVMLYMSFFPKIISGPLVLWKEFQEQRTEKKETCFTCSVGGAVCDLNRIMVGFAKKIILADTFGSTISHILEQEPHYDMGTAWLIALLYMFQIYYDFSGYSDIAIGTAGLFGYRIPDNFRFPYLSASVSEFWQRWHISLGRWFREYVYIPLGGNRKGIVRTCVNLSIVFLLTGVWHGATWGYILWVAVNGFFVVLELIVREWEWYKRIPRVYKWIFTLLIIFFSWQIFRLSDEMEFGAIFSFFKELFGKIRYTDTYFHWNYFLDKRLVCFLIVAALGSILPGTARIREWYDSQKERAGFYLVQEVVLLSLFVVSVLFMVNSNYQPFIYFRY